MAGNNLHCLTMTSNKELLSHIFPAARHCGTLDVASYLGYGRLQPRTAR
jgi:hypothetical protein